MIEKQAVIDFFDRCAPTWDAEIIRSDRKINIILDNARVGAGSRVLDVACGTGVLTPDYLARDVASVTAVDISPEMIRRARDKLRDDRVQFLCGDVETLDVGRDFDTVVVYNAFPHFPDPERLVAHLASLLRPGGVLTVAHGMGCAAIDGHHKGRASHVSRGLMSAQELAAIFEKYLTVTTVLSTEEMYQVAGEKRA